VPKHYSLIAAWLALGLLAVVSPAAAEQEAREQASQSLPEVVVTAEKMNQNVQEVPASISVFEAQILEDLRVNKTEQLFNMVPNLHMSQMGPQAIFGNPVSFRGIASFMTGKPVVSILVDDVYYPGMNFDLYDIERVEVLRGPQGTLYGHNTEAGVIKIITKQAGEEWTGRLALGAANYNTYEANFSTGGALIPQTLYLQAAGHFETSDGYFTNTYDDSDDVDKHHYFDGRFSLRWLPDAKTELTWNSDLQYYDSNYAEFAMLSQVESNPHDVSLDYPGYADKRAGGTSVKVERQVGSLSLVSITSYRKDDSDTSQDLDFTSWDMMRLDLSRDYQSINEELRLVSDQPGSKLKWVGGMYVFLEDDDHDYNTIMRPMSGYSGYLRQKGDTHTLGMALFAQGTYRFWEVLELTAGLRYDRQKKDFDYSWRGGAFGVPDETGSTDNTFDAWLPKVALSWRASPELMPYVSVSRGYQSGGFNLKADAGSSYDAEYAWNYEAGLKTQWLDKRLTVNLAAFYIDWTDIQVEQPDYPDFTIVNAASATSYGLEMDFRALTGLGLDIFGSAGYVHATFDEFTSGTDDYTDNRVPNVPEYTYNLGATYRFAGNFFVSAEYWGVGKFYWDSANSESQSFYQVVNAKAGYEREHLQVYLWGKNLFDENYATRAFKMSDEWYGRAGAPLCFGVTAAFTF